jgi:adenylate kinase family enzyme
MIIHIDGVQGSGKSYLCKKIKNIACIDTDDIMKEAYKIIENKQKTTKRNIRTLQNLNKVKSKLVDEYIANNENIIFVGMTAHIPSPTYKFFIKITDFTTVYKRLLTRELEKIVTNYKKIKEHINEENDPKRIYIQKIADMSLLQFPPSYNDFLQDYKDRLKEAVSKKYIPKTQDQLINIINKL